MDALREGVYLRAYAQKDPLIEYKTEAYDMFVELMANIKNEVAAQSLPQHLELAGLRELSLRRLPQFLMREQAPAAPTANWPAPRAPSGAHRRAGRRNGEAEATAGGKARARAGPTRDAEGRPQRAVSLRQRQEIQELLRPRCLTPDRPFQATVAQPNPIAESSWSLISPLTGIPLARL